MLDWIDTEDGEQNGWFTNKYGPPPPQLWPFKHFTSYMSVITPFME